MSDKSKNPKGIRVINYDNIDVYLSNRNLKDGAFYVLNAL
jgi:hypothetical protein